MGFYNQEPLLTQHEQYCPTYDTKIHHHNLRKTKDIQKYESFSQVEN